MNKKYFKKSELSMQIIIIAVLSVLVLAVSVASIISMYKKNNSQYDGQKEEIDNVWNNNKCLNILMSDSRKCVTLDKKTDFINKGWILVDGKFVDCKDKVCVKCPNGQNCD